MSVLTKRAYDKAGAKDGYRVLVDGLWPRGLTQDKLKVKEWMREIAPSAELRKWYGHKPEKWEQFRERFRAELGQGRRKELLETLVRRAQKEKLTLVLGARDVARSNAAVIAEMIRERLRG